MVDPASRRGGGGGGGLSDIASCVSLLWSPDGIAKGTRSPPQKRAVTLEPINDSVYTHCTFVNVEDVFS